MYKEYPYTTYFHDIDAMCECIKKVGYRLEVDADALKLIDSKGNVISTVTISYADKALTDVDGTPIKSYILDAAVGETTLVLTKGNGNAITLTIPYSTKAKEDVLGKDLTAYAYALSAVGDKLAITKGDGTTYEVTVPFAVKASTDVNGKDLTTYAATLSVDGDNIVLKDSANRELARITAPMAIKAFSDADGDEIASTYAATLEAGTTTIVLKAKDGNTLSTITVPFATAALTDNQGNGFLGSYAANLVVDGDGKRIGLESKNGTRLATITVPFATEATNATNAVQTVQVQGDQIIFTTFGGQSFTITSPYSVKAQKDDAGNTIKTTYIARVANNANTGAIEFYDAVGNLITSLTPTVTAATTDNYGNAIADYVKTILASASSDYVTVTHGDGDTEQITINYSTHAWKDTNENVIKNTYIKRLACIEDVNDGHYKLVAYNGDNPEAELFRIELTAYMAQRAIADENGVNINQKNIQQDNRMTSIENTIANLTYGKSLSLDNDTELSLLDQNNNILSTVYLPASGAKSVGAYWEEPTSVGDNTSKYARLGLMYDEDINIGDIVVANPAGSFNSNYVDLAALNRDNTGQSHFYINVHGLMEGNLTDPSYYADIDYISADRQWTFVVISEMTEYDQDSNEYTKYVLVPYSMLPIIDDEALNCSRTGRGITGSSISNVADLAGRLLFSYGCGTINTSQPVELVDSNGNSLTPDDSYLVIGANKEFTQMIKFNSGSNQVVGIKTYENNLVVPTSIYAAGSMGLPKSVPLYYDPTTGTYKLTNGVDLTNDNWVWFFVHGQYIS